LLCSQVVDESDRYTVGNTDASNVAFKKPWHSWTASSMELLTSAVVNHPAMAIYWGLLPFYMGNHMKAQTKAMTLWFAF
jgi:hypothetical protein